MFSRLNQLSLILFVAILLLTFPVHVFGQADLIPSKEIRAINNRCSGGLAIGLCELITRDDSLISKSWETIKGLFWGVAKEVNFNQAATNATNTDQGLTPVANNTTELPQTFKDTLCGEGNAGVYTEALPEFTDSPLSEVKDCEKGFDQAIFPDTVNVIIP